MGSDVVLVIVVATALAFDFTNGFHDTANAVATSISTRAMPPRVAVAIAAALNFVGAYAEEVRTRRFPGPEHSYGIAPEELERMRETLPQRRTVRA